jgi:hypothetical protein
VFIGDDHEALVCWVVACDAGVVEATELVVRDIEETLEHHRVWQAREVPLGIAV